METRWSRRTVIHHGQNSSPSLAGSPSPDPFVIFETQHSVSVTHWPRTSSMAPPRQIRRQPYFSSSLLPSFGHPALYAFLDTTDQQPSLANGWSGNSCGVPLPEPISRWNRPVQHTTPPQNPSWPPPTAHHRPMDVVRLPLQPSLEAYAEARSRPRKPSLNLRRDVYAPKESDGNEDKKSCTVCLEDFSVGQQVMLTPCNHMFHEDCIVPWADRSDHCPVCRSALSAPTYNS